MKFTIRHKNTEDVAAPEIPEAPEPDTIEFGNFIIGGGLIFLFILILLVVVSIASVVKLIRNWSAFGSMAVVWLLMIMMFGPLASLVFLFVPVPNKGKK